MTINYCETGLLGVNTYLVYDETGKGFIVDPGGFHQGLQRAIDDKGIDIEYIILTHGHCDHIGGVDDFRKLYPGCKVLAYEDEKSMLEDPSKNSSLQFFGYGVTVTCDEYVKDGDELTIGNMKLKFVHTPGHSKGGMCILVDDVCFSGDTLFRASIGRTDLYGGDFDEISESIRNKLYVLPDDTKVYPGHMGETTIGFEKRYNPFVQDRNQ